MPKSSSLPVIREETIINRIFIVRGQKIMIDRDLAEMYGVETRTLKQAVRRNLNRFPEDFMFEMTGTEFENWRSQIVISKQDRKGLRYAPFCFTEQGVTMLSCILNSEKAIAVNIQIVRVFSRMREMLLTHKDIFVKLEQIEKKLLQHDHQIQKHGEDIQAVFEAIKALLAPPAETRSRIGFRRSEELE
ncbi:MAG: ORF6N domain-containing protein [Candidatus Pseudobacter hemicellulosilyticus]|uniref:ORF6N domain-containing protein n=1 Tax=Candidatus Pseudobacter hemicellulosilyticus TaxID=3121375 RepID=A0AAJ5WT96_9BACT|nr:MAG: ORF6N domain-containing protein [Pseudobacter sp.]